MLKKDPLGRGLSAILRDVEEKGASKLIPIDQIVPNPEQPRLAMREEQLMELATSIQEKGLLQPILLRRKDGKYEIIAGERRFRASLIAGLKEVPAIIKEVDDREALEIALTENLQREDLNPVEVAIVYERFLKEFAYTQEDLAKKIGIDRSSISNFIRLLKLPEWIKDLMHDGKLTQGHGRVLTSLKSEKEQKRFVDRVLNEGISVRELEREVKKKRAQKDSSFSFVEETLREILHTKVNITYRKNKGKIIIEFYSKEDLERITSLFSEKD
jgi:ParB family transcriptional regulator, chromosome partitioning protein